MITQLRKPPTPEEIEETRQRLKTMPQYRVAPPASRLAPPPDNGGSSKGQDVAAGQPIPTLEEWLSARDFSVPKYTAMLRKVGVGEPEIPDMVEMVQKELKATYEQKYTKTKPLLDAKNIFSKFKLERNVTGDFLTGIQETATRLGEAWQVVIPQYLATSSPEPPTFEEFAPGVDEKHPRREEAEALYRQEYGRVWADRQRVMSQTGDKLVEYEGKLNEWIGSHPEYRPKPEWEGGLVASIKRDPSLLANPDFIAYAVVRNSVPTLAAMAISIPTTALTGSPILGAAASFPMFASIETADLYTDLIASGANQEDASKLAVPIGAVIGSMELVGELPILQALSPVFKGPLMENIRREVVRLTLGGLIAKGAKEYTKLVAFETITEVLQEAAHNAAVKTVDENRDILANIDEVAVATIFSVQPWALLGGGASVSTSVRQARAAPTVTPPIAPAGEPPPTAIPKEVTPPISEAGQPEAGLQAGMMGVSDKEVRPQGMGRVTQV